MFFLGLQAMFNPSVQQKKNLRKWIKALRSGKFIQARNTLEDTRNENKSHCCLGVACRIFPEIITDERTENHETRFTFKNGRNLAGSIPVDIFTDIFDFGTEAEVIQNELMKYNDGTSIAWGDSNFLEISNMLEDYLIGCEVFAEAEADEYEGEFGDNPAGLGAND